MEFDDFDISERKMWFCDINYGLIGFGGGGGGAESVSAKEIESKDELLSEESGKFNIWLRNG